MCMDTKAELFTRGRRERERERERERVSEMLLNVIIVPNDNGGIQLERFNDAK